MDRFGISTMYVPAPGTPGEGAIYVSASRWQDDLCVESIPIMQRYVTSIGDNTDRRQLTEFAQEMIDMAYGLLSEFYAQSKRASTGETNARPSNRSIP